MPVYTGIPGAGPKAFARPFPHKMEAGEGFGPPGACAPAIFKTATLNHSVIPPILELAEEEGVGPPRLFTLAGFRDQCRRQSACSSLNLVHTAGFDTCTSCAQMRYSRVLGRLTDP